MPRLSLSRVLPYRREALFALVADVERYPDFVPGWLAATILRRERDIYCTQQIVKFGPLTERFTTKTVLRPPNEIDVSAIDGPFDRFALTWRFAALAGGGCEVALAADVRLRNAILGALSGRKLADGFAAVLAAFEERARRLYGSPRRLEADQGVGPPADVSGFAGAAAAKNVRLP